MNRKILYVPIGALSPVKLKRLRVVHVLDSYERRGEAKDYIATGAIARGGSMPVNTNGGLIGEAYIHGMNLITEAVRQIRGTAVNQVANAGRVLMSSGVNTCILGRDG